MATKVLVINPAEQSIVEKTVEGLDEVKTMIGFDTVIADEIGPGADRLFFDEECFLRGTTGRFQIDSIIPVSGMGVIAGSDDEGKTLTDVTSTVETLTARLKYL